MNAYWFGLLTLPALAGALAGLYGLYRGAGWLLDHSPIRRIATTGRPDDVATTASVVAACPAVWALRISEYLTVLVAAGRVDHAAAKTVRRAVYRELVPPPRLTRLTPEERERRLQQTDDNEETTDGV